MAKNNTPRHRHSDITARLRGGDQQRIADRANCTKSTVSRVLNGKLGQDTPLAINIIRIAERMIENYS